MDNATEYCNLDFNDYLKKEGLEVVTTAPYTPQQNDRMERNTRTIMESARSVNYGSPVPKYCSVIRRLPIQLRSAVDW